jgi:hypothetical protein
MVGVAPFILFALMLEIFCEIKREIKDFITLLAMRLYKML